MRVTNPQIDELKENEIFVFGSNYPKGIHGAGAAKLAHQKFGAKWGVGFGLQGQSFAIPTKDHNINTMPIGVIKDYVYHFIEFAKIKPELTFMVTAIGTGLAGYNAKEIALLFKEALQLENVYLPEEFINVLSKDVVRLKASKNIDFKFCS